MSVDNVQFKSYGQGKVLRHEGQRSQSRSLGQNFWHERKGLITKNVHLTYESTTFNG